MPQYESRRIATNMPFRKSFHSTLIEAVMFISLVALMGHLSVNFWERYVLQTELTKMKTSLHSLRETVNTIGIAYDTLHKEVKELADIAEKTPSPLCFPEIPKKEPDKQTKSKDKAVLYPQDFQVQTMKIQKIPKKIGSVLLTRNKSTVYTPSIVEKDLAPGLHKSEKIINVKDFDNVQETREETTQVETYEKTTQVLVAPVTKNGSTITRYPIKSTGVGNDKIPKHFSLKQHNEKHHNIEKDPINKNFIYNKENKASSVHKCYQDHYIRNVKEAECNWPW